MTPGDIGAILYLPSPHPDNGFTFKYRSAHAPTNPDGNGTPEQFRSSDYPAKYYAQALLSVETNAEPPHPYIALRIEPDRLSVVDYDGEEFHELDSAQVPTSANTWYTVQLRIVAGGPDGAFLSVERTSPSAGDAVAVLACPPGTAAADYGRSLYSRLRSLDKQGASRILAEAVPASSEWDAVRDRLARAAATFL